MASIGSILNTARGPAQVVQILPTRTHYDAKTWADAVATPLAGQTIDPRTTLGQSQTKSTIVQVEIEESIKQAQEKQQLQQKAVTQTTTVASALIGSLAYKTTQQNTDTAKLTLAIG